MTTQLIIAIEDIYIEELKKYDIKKHTQNLYEDDGKCIICKEYKNRILPLPINKDNYTITVHCNVCSWLCLKLFLKSEKHAIYNYTTNIILAIIEIINPSLINYENVFS